MELDKIKTNYSRNIRNFNKKRKEGLNAFEMVGKGICLGCDECLGTADQKPTTNRRHVISSINATAEAMMIGVFSEGINPLSQQDTWNSTY